MDWSWIKDWGTPALTGVLGILGTIITIYAKDRGDKAERDIKQAAISMSAQATREQAQMNLDASTAATLTERFKALMDGYEHRIDDLSRDLKEYRDRQKRLERDFSVHKSICNECVTYKQYMKDHPDAFTAA